MKIYFADIETTGLLHHLVEQGVRAKLHNLCVKSVCGDNKVFHANTESDREKLESFLQGESVFVMHNGICYDKNALTHFGYDISNIHFVDTLALSWYLDINRPKHGLESYGYECGVPKPEVEDWVGLSQDEYDDRVKKDVEIQEYVYYKLKARFEELYGKMTDLEFCTHRVVKYLNFKMTQLEEQQNTKWKVDLVKARRLEFEFTQKLDEKNVELRSVMPKVPEYTKHKKPAKPFLKSGELSATGVRWSELCSAAGVDFDFDGEIKRVKGYNEPNPQSPQQVKDWLFSLGWKPTTFKFDRNKETGVERNIPQVYIPKSGGQICESIVELSDKVPEVKALVGVGVLTHRRGCVRGFIDSIVSDDCVEASADGFTNTLRLKHRKPCVNLPSSRVEYGEDVRSCLVAKEGKVLCGSDLSSLESTIKFNLQLPYDRAYVMSQMSKDFDPHLDIALEAGLLKQEEVWFYKIYKEGFDRSDYPTCDKLDDMLTYPDELKMLIVKEISEIRGKGKNGNYACQYGAGGATVARTAGVDLSVGKKIVKAYKKLNWSIDKIAQSQVSKSTSFGKYQINPYNGIWYNLVADKDKFSTLVQGTGSYVLDLWLSYQFKIKSDYSLGNDAARLVATFHDEQIIENDCGYDDVLGKLISDALDLVNKKFKLEIPFGCDTQFGSKYSEIH